MNPAHRDHDELLIARLASGDADVVDRATGDGQLSSCQDCRTLYADLQAIRSFTSDATLRVPPRPRSFRLSPDELARLRGPRWRRWLAGFGAPKFDIVRPLATAVAGLGLAVLVVGSGLPSFGPVGLGRPAAAPVPASPAAAESGAPAPAVGAETSPQPAPGQFDSAKESVRAGSQVPSAAPTSPLRSRELETFGGEPGQLPLVPLGGAAVASGLALVILNAAARRAAGR